MFTYFDHPHLIALYNKSIEIGWGQFNDVTICGIQSKCLPNA